MNVLFNVMIITFILAQIACVFGKYVKCKDGYTEYKPNTFLSLLSISVLVVISGFRDGIGDTDTYRDIVDGLGNNLIEFLRNPTITEDTGFYAIDVFIKQFISEESQVFLFIMALITLFAMIWRLRLDSDMFGVAVFIFSATSCYLTSMNGVRQSFVSSLLFLVYPLIYYRKWYIYIPIVLLLSTCHGSALIFIPLYFVLNCKGWGRMTWFIVFAGVFLYISYPVTGPIIAQILGETQYGNYSEVLMSSGNGANIIRVAVYLVPVILTYLGRERLKVYRYYNIIINATVINAMVMLLATRYWIYARFNMYFALYAIIAICWCLKSLFSGKNRAIITGICLLMFGLFYWYELYNLRLVYHSSILHI